MTNNQNTSDNLFTETQRFKQWWLWVLLLSVNGIFLYGIYKQAICGEQFGNNPGSNASLITSFVITVIVTILFANIHLDTIIKEDGIYVRFFPINIKYKFIPWENVSKCYVRQYNAIVEYGGWGLRLGFFGKGKALNISGNKGLQLETNDGKRLLIGTQQPDELATALMVLKRHKE